MKRIFSAMLALAGVVAAPGAAFSADYITAPLPVPTVCNDHGVLASIVDDFDYAEAHLLHNGLAIEDFSSIQLSRYEPKTERNLIERHYCKAFANMTDSQVRPVWYLVETDMGFAGIAGNNVEFCVAGLDPLRVYGADCNILQ